MPRRFMFKEYRGLADPRVIYYRRGSAASRLSPADVVPGYLASAKYLHLTGITAALSDSCREAVHSAISAVRSAGVHRDLSGRGMKKGPPEQEVPLCA